MGIAVGLLGFPLLPFNRCFCFDQRVIRLRASLEVLRPGPRPRGYNPSVFSGSCSFSRLFSPSTFSDPGCWLRLDVLRYVSIYPNAGFLSLSSINSPSILFGGFLGVSGTSKPVHGLRYRILFFWDDWWGRPACRLSSLNGMGRTIQFICSLLITTIRL